MTISVKLVNDEIKRITTTNTAMDMLLEFEKILEDVNLYAYKNWIEGEVFEGPIIERHYVTVKLLYPREMMPDPAGAKRLFARDCLVKFEKEELLVPVKVKSFDDVRTETREDGSMVRKPKTKTEPVWVVEIKMPRRYVDEFSTDSIELEDDEYLDTESLNTENVIDTEQQMTGNDDLGFDDEGTI